MIYLDIRWSRGEQPESTQAEFALSTQVKFADLGSFGVPGGSPGTTLS